MLIIYYTILRIQVKSSTNSYTKANQPTVQEIKNSMTNGKL